MGRILLLRRVERDLDQLLLVVDIEDLAEGLVALGVDLDENAALGDGRHVDRALLVGAHLKLGAGVAGETGPRVLLVGLPANDDRSALDPSGSGLS